jgi:enoyl-[acyl-carrier-protein] reductase (NADH)
MGLDQFRHLLQEPELGEPHIQVPDLTGKVILVIGGSRVSGFGYNFGKVAATEGNAKVILTASSKKSERRLLKRRSFDFDSAVIDVRDEAQYLLLEERVHRQYGRLDAALVAPAYINPEYLRIGLEWQDIPNPVRKECMEISVYPTEKVTRYFRELLSESSGVVYGVSFPLKDLPGYTIGAAKDMLEKMVTENLAPNYADRNIRVNVLSIGPFDSLSSSVIPGYHILTRIQKSTGCRLPGLGEIARESVAKINDDQTGQIYLIDGGLSEAAEKYRPSVQRIFRQFS